MANYETKVSLPSNGVLYKNDESLPTEVTLRSMTTKDEKLIFGSSNGDIVNKVLANCIKEDIDIMKLVNQDKMYLLIQLRILSYGPYYHINATSPSDGVSREYKIDLSELGVKKLDEKEYKKNTSFTLPRSKDQVVVQLLDGYASKKVDDNIRKQLKMAAESKAKLSYDDAEFEQTNAERLVSVNGKDLSHVEKLKYFDNMLAMDSAFIRDRIDNITFGIDDTVDLENPADGEHFIGFYQMGPEFFHPRFD